MTFTLLGVPGDQVVIQGSTYCQGFSNFISDATYLYWQTSTAADLSCFGSYKHELNRTNAWIAVWPSAVTGQDATHLYGLEHPASGRWLIDVLAK